MLNTAFGTTHIKYTLKPERPRKKWSRPLEKKKPKKLTDIQTDNSELATWNILHQQLVRRKAVIV